MSPRKKAPVVAATRPRERGGRSRQRQRLIDACISALHLYGPSRTTVEKVVAIAKMSPGIVRFYFDSKAAMLIASLQFLSAEFEDQVLVPVAKLKTDPVAALQRMVELYLDPDIASPRKVSVWYAFWGEASSRQEYYDICGQKDESFAALVHELIETLIAQTAQSHLDADGVALGLIGALEILWQDIAFQTEHDIDRPAARRRCIAYLRSVFPGYFPTPTEDPALPAPVLPIRVPRWTYNNSRLWVMERDALFQPAWVVVGHESQIPKCGDFITTDIGVERVLLIRHAAGAVHALRNSCPEVPHTLVVDRQGHFDRAIECREHGLRFSLDGTGTARDLKALDLDSVGGLLWSTSSRPEPSMSAALNVPLEVETVSGLMMLAPPVEFRVEADWKLVIEQWLQTATPDAVPTTASVSLSWDGALLHPAGWSAGRYMSLMACLPDRTWRRQFIAPHQLLESRPDGLSVLQALPIAAGRTLLRRLDYSALPPDDGARAALYLAQRLGRLTRASMRHMAESVQRGFVDFGYDRLPDAQAPSAAIAWFRALLAARLPALLRERPPTDR